MMTVLVVDDELHARRGIVLRLQRYPDFQLIGECGNGKAALQSIERLKPALVFLDIHMPGINGLEVLRRLSKDCTSSFIFLTAFDAYALNAFEFHAVDYLLKPIDDTRFTEALERVRRTSRLASLEEKYAQLQELINSERNTQRASFLRRFAIKTRDRVAFVRSEEIDWIEATGDYAGLHVGNKTFLIRTSINELARRLDPTAFTRVHRSAIVQIDRIVRIAPAVSGDARLTLSTGDEVRVSRSFSKPLRKILRNGNQVVCRADGSEAGIHKVIQ
jgi:two-component system LytT family response regulator